ncbi:MAG: hypothetical protein AAGC73_03235 [Verrucomicrobiota bacterium]
MKTLSTILMLAFLGNCFLGCSSRPTDRISQNEALFNTYTPAEQKLIRIGEVAVGFDQDQVRMALGDPSHEATIDTASGKQIVWEYTEVKPKLGFSVGAAAGTWKSSGLGVGVSARPDNSKVIKRVAFDRVTGEVSKVESFN